MKRMVYYFVIVSQVVVLLFLTIQYERIDRHGQMIKLLTITPEYEFYHDETYNNDIYLDFEINQIHHENWHIDSSIATNDRVYVLLKSEANEIYHVVKATTENISAQNNDEFVLLGTYSYSDEHMKSHYVRYGMERINNIDQFRNLKYDQSMIVTLLVSERWGQKKIIDVENTR